MLAVIPSDPLESYDKAGISSWLEDYYNPLRFFDRVYALSPLEKEQGDRYGMHVIPTRPRQLKKRIRDLGVDLVRAYGGYWACDMACEHKVEGVPVVVSVHDTDPGKVHRSIARADVVLCVSEAVKKAVMRHRDDPDGVWVLPNRVDFEIMQRYREEDVAFIAARFPARYGILHVGRKSKQKNLDTVIKAMRLIGDDYCLLAIGRGDEKEYRDLAEKNRVTDRCHFLECVDNRELALYYSWARCLCNPSRWEGFGIIFIEALACSTVVLTSDLAPMNEYIRHGENGLLLKDYEDPEALADMVRAACTDMELRKGLMANARRSVEAFDKNKVDELEVECYRKVLDMRSGTRIRSR